MILPVLEAMKILIAVFWVFINNFITYLLNTKTTAN